MRKNLKMIKIREIYKNKFIICSESNMLFFSDFKVIKDIYEYNFAYKKDDLKTTIVNIEYYNFIDVVDKSNHKSHSQAQNIN